MEVLSRSATRQVAFAEPTVYVYQPIPPVVDIDDSQFERPKVEQLIPRERLIQRMVARKAVFSIQQYLRENSDAYPRREDQIRLSEFASKFSQRAKDIALEAARVNCLEAYSDPDAQYPTSIFTSIDLIAPVKLTEFPQFQMMPRRVSLEDLPETKKATKRKRCEL